MHSELTTDLSIIRRNLNNFNSDKENVVLIKTGSLNPIHRSHLSNLIKTKEYLENLSDLNVLGGLISPSHDQYVLGKLGEEYLPAHLRIQLCEKAIKEENLQDWLSVDKAECLARCFSSLSQVTLSLQNFVNQQIQFPKSIRVIYVAGLDLFNDCNGMESLRTSSMGGVAVVYRSGENKSLVQSLIDQNSSKLYFISLDSNEQNDISSTLIREKLRNNEDCSHLTYHSVLEHLRMRK